MRIESSPPTVTFALLLYYSAAMAVSPARADMAASQSAADLQPQIGDCRVGFDGRYKVGYWTPVWVDVQGARELADPQIELTVLDSDGVETTVSAAVANGTSTRVLLYVKIGRLSSPLRVRLTSGGEEIDRQVLEPAAARVGRPVLDPLSATGELILSVGGGESGIAEAFTPRNEATGELPRRLVEVERVADLPDRWFGYESVDVLVLSAADAERAGELAADAERLAAVRRWVELGGRMVLVWGGEQAAELLEESAPFAAFVPGTYLETVRLPQATPLEHFAESDARIADRGPGIEVLVPRLAEVRGQIDVYGPPPTNLPLVIRAPLGLGEVTFAGVDLATSPLAEWPGRPGFWRSLVRPYIVQGETASGPQTLGTLGYDDLSGALRQRLGRAFQAVRTVTFPVVALLVLVYVLLLGPAHYWLVHHYGGRPALAWVVFPLLVVVASGGAYWLGRVSKGERAQVNELELVDFDMTTGTARGTYWAALYSPRSERYDLALQVPPVHASAGEDEAIAAAETLFSWWGLPGIGVGGMQADSANLAAIGAAYRFAPQLDRLEGVPVLTSATKSLTARWTAPIDDVIVAEFADDNGMAVGTLRNETGRVLINCRLLYGGWAYRVGDIRPGASVDVGPQLRPVRTTTLVAAAARGIAIAQLDTERRVFLAERASTDELLATMMFYRLAGGRAFAGLPSRYQSECDLSRLLELGRALLWAETDGTGSKLIDAATGEPLGSGQGRSRVIYRFVLPVGLNR